MLYIHTSETLAIYSGPTDEPFKRWQFVQWQYALKIGGAETVKDTLPQKQLPLSTGLGWAPGLAFGVSDTVFGFNMLARLFIVFMILSLVIQRLRICIR